MGLIFPKHSEAIIPGIAREKPDAIPLFFPLWKIPRSSLYSNVLKVLGMGPPCTFQIRNASPLIVRNYVISLISSSSSVSLRIFKFRDWSSDLVF